MMPTTLTYFMKHIFILLFCLFTYTSFAQIGTCIEVPQGSGNWVRQDGSPCDPPLITVVPFLRIAPDARSTGMGNVGLATSADVNRMNFNASKYSFSEKEGGIALNVVPWLRNLGLTDIYLAYLSGYYKFDKMQAVAASVRYFSLGEFTFTDLNRNVIGTGHPHEFELAVAYSRKLSDYLSASLTGKFIYSNLAAGQTTTEGIDIVSAKTFAVDIGFSYKKPLNTKTKSTLGVGLALTNIGDKIKYTKTYDGDVLPANIGLGFAWDIDMDEFNRITLGLDFNKLLVPSPSFVDNNNDSIPDYRQKGVLDGIFGSFSDAIGGGKEELKEILIGFGAEYWYNDLFALRAGYTYENPRKGNGRYITLGMGLKYSTFGLGLSYIVPTSNFRNALDNTLRFSIIFDFGTFKPDKGAQ
jgi:hypothetical protein